MCRQHAKAAQVRIGLDQFRLKGQDGAFRQFVSFEELRGLVDMLRYCGPLSVGYDGGDAFHLYVQPEAAGGVVARFASFGIRAEAAEGGR